MPRPAIDRYWQAAITALAEADKASLSVDAIVASLKEQAPPAGVSDPVPSARTVARYVKDARNAAEKDRLPYRVFSWPQSMEEGSLPWEASRVLFDWLRDRADKGRPAPLVDEARWFWRVTLAIPEAPFADRADIAGHLTLVERYGCQPHAGAPEILQRLLTYQPWRSDDDKRAYEAEPKKAVVTMMRESHVVSIDLTNPYARQLIGREGFEKGYKGE